MKKRNQIKKIIEQRHMSRRQFLIGASKTMIALPPLLSLLPQELIAQVAQKKVRAMTFVNCFGVDAYQMFPDDPAIMTPYAGALHTSYCRLSSLDKRVSRVVDFNNSLLDGLQNQTNVVRGLDLVGGRTGGHNHSVLSGTHAGGRAPTLGASIDTIIERRLGVNAIRLKTHNATTKTDQFSFWRERSGAERQVSSLTYGDEKLFNILFPNGSQSSPPSSQPTKNELVLDKVLEDIKALENNKRLSTEDKIRLDQYLTSIHEVQKNLVARRLPAATCGSANIDFEVTSSAAPGSSNKLYDNYAELIALAVQCDRARVVHIANTAVSNTENNRSHPELHHDCTGGSNGNADRNAWFLQRVANLAKKLDSRTDPFDPDGNSLLYNSLLYWTNELGQWNTSHSTTQLPTVTFGSGGGYFKTGYYVDYRHKPLRLYRNSSNHYFGRPMKQLLISIMQAAGVQPKDYLNIGDGNGFGEWKPFVEKAKTDENKNHYRMYESEHNDPLPFLKA